MIRKVLAVGVVAAMLGNAPAALAAPGYSIRWINCAGEGTGTDNRVFACNTNAGTSQLVVSYELPADLAQVSGNEITIDILSQLPALPAWWDFKNVGTCRQTSLVFNTTFDPTNVVCEDWAQGQSSGGIGAYSTGTPPSMGNIDPSLAPLHRRCVIALAVPPSALQNLVVGVEYFACNLLIDNQKTVGAGNCAGCTEPMCVVLNALNVTTPVVDNNIFIGHPSSPGLNMVTWQGSGPNCNAVPVKNRTWGELKALYR